LVILYNLNLMVAFLRYYSSFTYWIYSCICSSIRSFKYPFLSFNLSLFNFACMAYFFNFSYRQYVTNL